MNVGFLGRRSLIPAYRSARLCDLRPLFWEADFFDLEELEIIDTFQNVRETAKKAIRLLKENNEKI